MDLNKRKILEDAGVLYPSVVTNADKIRAMTDEDLAMLLQPGCPSRMCRDCPPHDCYNCWLDWLKKEATNDQNNS